MIAARYEDKLPSEHNRITTRNTWPIGLVWRRYERCQIALTLKTIPHGRRRQVELIHRRQLQNELDRLDHARLITVRRIDEFASGIRANNKRYGAVAVYVIKAGLGSSSTTKMQVCGQNLLLLIASMIWPSARSLSATMARGVGMPGRVPSVWLHGNVNWIRLGNSPLFS
jgi:hypothetical protein